MILPDCRQKYARDAYPYGSQFRRREDFAEDELNPYWDQQVKGEAGGIPAGLRCLHGAHSQRLFPQCRGIYKR